MGTHEGRVALVTGASGGIGRAAAEIFAREGARVAVVDVKVDEGVETVRRIEKAGGEAFFLEADLTEESAVKRMVAEVVARYGQLDSAFNNAGISDAHVAFHEMTADSWKKMIDINLSAVFFCMKHEIAQMLTQPKVEGRRGVIVNTSSGAGIVPAPGQPHYTAAKHGVLGLMKCAASEYAMEGIRCNSVLPGVTETPMVAGYLDANGPEARAQLEGTVPGGVFGQPEEVGELAVWLCSDQASRVSGQGVVVDGGGVFH